MASPSELAKRVAAVLDAGLRRGRPGAVYVTAIVIAAALFVVAISPLRVVARASASQAEQEQKLSFEVAAIKPTAPDFRGGRFMTMQGAHQFVVRNYTLKFMVATAYNLPPRAVSGGPAWVNSDLYDIDAATPGDARPNTQQQLSMLRTLLADRFNLTFHHEKRDLPVYELTVARGGAKLKQSAPSSEEYLINRVFPDRVFLPARSVTMAQFASMLQRSVLDRPVLEKTGLQGKYDFDLEWAPDETQFDGLLTIPNPQKPDLFSAMQQQLGLRLQGSNGAVDVIVIDRVDRPSEN